MPPSDGRPPRSATVDGRDVAFRRRRDGEGQVERLVGIVARGRSNVRSSSSGRTGPRRGSLLGPLLGGSSSNNDQLFQFVATNRAGRRLRRTTRWRDDPQRSRVDPRAGVGSFRSKQVDGLVRPGVAVRSQADADGGRIGTERVVTRRRPRADQPGGPTVDHRVIVAATSRSASDGRCPSVPGLAARAVPSLARAAPRLLGDIDSDPRSPQHRYRVGRRVRSGCTPPGVRTSMPAGRVVGRAERRAPPRRRRWRCPTSWPGAAPPGR